MVYWLARCQNMQWGEAEERAADEAWAAVRAEDEESMMSTRDERTLPAEVAVEIARHQLARIGKPAPDDLIGFCPQCETWRRRYECRQVARDETCLHACRVCGATIDESPPF